MKFDRLLVDDGIISIHTETKEVHKFLDKGVSNYGGYHRYFDNNHDPEIIRYKLKKGEPLIKTDDLSFLNKILEHVKAKTRSTSEKTDLLRVAYGHSLLDEMWSNYYSKNREYPNNIEEFLIECLKEYKYRNYHLRKIT